jgi:hypothetical protein
MDLKAYYLTREKEDAEIKSHMLRQKSLGSLTYITYKNTGVAGKAAQNFELDSLIAPFYAFVSQVSKMTEYYLVE